MARPQSARWIFGISAALLIAIGVGAVSITASCQAEPRKRDRRGVEEPVYRVTNRTEQVRREHPLAPALRIAEAGLTNIRENIDDYTCTLVKRERVDGKLRDPEYMFAKIRNRKVRDGRVVKPFSVYLYFLAPEGMKGRQVLYVEGRNGGKLMAREARGLAALAGTVSLNPESNLAMRGNKYPITEIGIENLVSKLVDRMKQDMQFGECDVKFYQGAKINGRVCTCIEAIHPKRRKNFLFHIARVFIDDELRIPIRYEAYDWPDGAGGKPKLLESYTYLNVKLNVGLTDADFDPNNRKYSFK